ncbi:MAG: DUF3822 family protein [Flavobacteriales bacterium]
MGTSFTSDRFTALEPHAMHVSLLQGPAFAAWCAHERSTGSVVALRAVHSSELPPLSGSLADPGSASSIVLPEWSVLVPDGALLEGTEAVHLRAAFGHEPLGVLRRDPVEALAAQSIHVHEPGAESQAMAQMPLARPLALQALLVRAAMSRRAERDVLLLHLGTDRMDVVLATHGSIALSNGFPVRTPEDALYFALLATERTKHQPQDLQVLFCGPQAHDNVIALLERYFEHCAPAEPQMPLAIERPERWLALTEQFACV